MKFYTYHDLAAVLRVHPKTVSRWVIALEKQRRFVLFRPTRTTVRISEDNLSELLRRKISK